ncbi:MAG: MFS transporter [Peptococcaceae bacterium]|nr:MFS transporter [Peptococcaceae bacterium]
MTGPVNVNSSERYSVKDRMERLPISNYHRLVCFALFISWFCEAIDLGGTGFLMPLILQHFHLTAVQGGYFSSLAFAGMMIGSLFAGALSDTFGRTRLVCCCMVVWGIAGMFMAFAQNIPWLFTARFILGLGLGAQVPVAMAYLSEIIPTHSRAKYMTFYQMLVPVGIAFAGLLTVLILPHFGWRGVYFAESIPALSLFLIMKFCPESGFWLESRGRLAEADAIADHWEYRVKKDNNLTELPPVVRATEMREPGKISELFSKKYSKILAMALIWYTACMMSDYGLATWLTTLLVAKGFDVIRSTGFVAIGVCGGIPAWFFTAWVTEKFGRKWGIFICSILTAIFAYLYGSSTTMTMLIIFGIFYQFGKYGLAMSNNVYTPELFETHLRATGNGFTLACGRMGSMLGPMVLAFVMSSLGANATFYVAAGIALLSGIAVMILGPETKGKQLR